ncbi:unnamed protein product [Periconia digitata]|uniref:Uncharacterized protein n=1 Tax=Periconia digitata TaxID=1303443 RepID=A0A9W4XGT1_9PLEO|nr:unnamed protein product [Periconia digitata]
MCEHQPKPLLFPNDSPSVVSADDTICRYMIRSLVDCMSRTRLYSHTAASSGENCFSAPNSAHPSQSPFFALKNGAYQLNHIKSL